MILQFQPSKMILKCLGVVSVLVPLQEEREKVAMVFFHTCNNHHMIILYNQSVTVLVPWRYDCFSYQYVCLGRCLNCTFFKNSTDYFVCLHVVICRSTGMSRYPQMQQINNTFMRVPTKDHTVEIVHILMNMHVYTNPLNENLGQTVLE